MAIWIASILRIGTTWADDVQVNTYTSGDQFSSSVASDADGDTVVVWTSVGGTDSSAYSIRGQRYASDGSTLGGEFQVNTYSSNRQGGPQVAMDAAGGFIVVWSSNGSSGTDTSSYSVQGQRYASDGSTLGGEFQVNTYTSDRQSAGSVAIDADGDFIVTWASYGSVGTDTASSSIQGQLFASNGSTVGGQFQVNSYTSYRQTLSSVAMADAGQFVIVWEKNSYTYYSVQGQRFASDGSAVGEEFLINNDPFRHQYRARVAMDAVGEFIVVWSGHYNQDIHGQRFASDGSTVGNQLQVNTYTTESQRIASVAMDDLGDFIVVWQSEGSIDTDSDGESIQARRFASNGSAIGAEFQVNMFTTDRQIGPAVAIDDDGDVVIVWSSVGSAGTDSDGRSIQRTQGRSIFRDGFESGDTSAWSLAQGAARLDHR